MIKRGINIGDHFENPPKPGVVFENPMRDWYYGLIRKLGFDHIRLPVRWSAHCDDANGHRIDPRFMGMVADAVDRFLELDLTVVLNIHHFVEAAVDPKTHEAKLYALWEQIAAAFQNRPDKLIFEVMNEPKKQVPADVWNEVQNRTVAVIRKTNPTRTVMIGSVDYNGLFSLKDLVPPAGDRHLIGSFHYYFPLEFTHQGASWAAAYKDLKNVGWEGTPAEVEDVRRGLLEAKKWADKYNLPVNLGEFGALSTADMAARARWTRCVRETAESLGFSWSYWEFNRGFGICDRQTGELRQPLVDALLKD